MKIKYTIVLILIVGLHSCSIAEKTKNIATAIDVVSTVHKTTKSLIGRKLQTASETVVSDTLSIKQTP